MKLEELNNIDKKYLLENITIYNHGDYFILEWLYFTGCPHDIEDGIDNVKDKFAEAILKELEKPKEKELYTEIMEMI